MGGGGGESICIPTPIEEDCSICLNDYSRSVDNSTFSALIHLSHRRLKSPSSALPMPTCVR